MKEPQSLGAHPTPKKAFLLDPKAVKAHRAMIDDDDFRRSITVAQAQYTRVICDLAPISLDSPNQLQASAMCFQRIQGMNDFVTVLMNLGETPKLPERKSTDNLEHEA